MTALAILAAVVALGIAIQVIRNALAERAFQRMLDEERAETLQRFHADQRAQYERRKLRESFSEYPFPPRSDR